jgi:S1-C subfamily serine protease
LAGQVVGINTAIVDNTNGIAFALPITSEFINNTIDSISMYGNIVRPLIGISYVDISKENKSQLKTSVDYGIYIKDVFDGLPADEAGLNI